MILFHLDQPEKHAADNPAAHPELLGSIWIVLVFIMTIKMPMTTLTILTNLKTQLTLITSVLAKLGQIWKKSKACKHCLQNIFEIVALQWPPTSLFENI